MTAEPLRIGLLIEGPLVSRHVQELVGWIHAQANMRLDHLFIRTRDAGSTRRSGAGLYAAFSRQVFRAIERAEEARLKRGSRYSDSTRKFDIRSVIPHVIEVPSGTSASPPMPDLPGSVQLDVLLAPEGDDELERIAQVARFGVWSVEYTGRPNACSGPVGFWEVFGRRDSTAFSICRHRSSPEAGKDELLRGRLPTRHYFALNRTVLLERAHHYLKVLLERTAKSGREQPPSRTALPDGEPPAGMPAAHHSFAYAAQMLGASLRKRAQRLMGKEYCWEVSFARQRWTGAVLADAAVIENPAGRYIADPFVIRRDGRDICFVEDYDRRSGRGRISAFEMDGPAAICLGLVIEENFHLSFPYLFEFDGNLLMCPESSENRDVRVYRCVDFPMRWQLEKVIMSDVSAADSMLFEMEGRWWMLTNIDPCGSGDHCSELLAFHSRSPLDGDWTPHPNNPLLIDSCSARNGGLLRDGDRIFRVSQRQGFDRYGQGSQINEILELTERDYREACAATIRPSFRRGLVGTHHMHSSGGITVFDSLKLS